MASSDLPASPTHAPSAVQEASAAGHDAESMTGEEGTRRGGYGLTDAAQSLALVVCWGLMILGFGLGLGNMFLSWSNFGNMFSSETVLLVLALGLLIPLTSGDFDLSVASVLTFTAMTIAVLNVNHHWSIWAAIGVAVGIALVIGLINGLLIVLLEIESLIVTLASATVVAGLSLWISNTSTITGTDPVLSNLVITDRFLGISLQLYYGLAIALVLWLIFDFTPAGRRLLFVGRGRNVARLSGIKVGRVRIYALMASAGLAGVAGVIFTGTTGGADPTSGSSFLLPAFAAAFLGSTTIRPGRFNPLGTLIAVYFLVTGITGLELWGAQAYVQQLFYGGALLVAVAASRLVRRRSVA